MAQNTENTELAKKVGWVSQNIEADKSTIQMFAWHGKACYPGKYHNQSSIQTGCMRAFIWMEVHFCGEVNSVLSKIY
jgi:hypothetical protein